MRVMVLHVMTGGAPPALEPTPEALEAWAAMDRYTEELTAAGVMVAAAGLKPDAKRVAVEGGEWAVYDGPFAEVKEMIAGFSIWQVKDLDEAVSWARRAPTGLPGEGFMEIRPFYEAEDLGEFLTPGEQGQTRDGERGKLGVA